MNWIFDYQPAEVHGIYAFDSKQNIGERDKPFVLEIDEDSESYKEYPDCYNSGCCP